MKRRTYVPTQLGVTRAQVGDEDVIFLDMIVLLPGVRQQRGMAFVLSPEYAAMVAAELTKAVEAGEEQ